jgi:hypothetical protein
MKISHFMIKDPSLMVGTNFNLVAEKRGRNILNPMVGKTWQRGQSYYLFFALVYWRSEWSCIMFIKASRLNDVGSQSLRWSSWS